MTTSTNHRGRGVLAITATVVCGLLALLATPAGAQEDPYGSTTTTEAPAITPECEVELAAEGDGLDALVSLSSVPLGAEVRILLDGDEVARDTAPTEASSPGASSTQLDIPFSLLERPSAPFGITAVGADFTVTCELSGGQVLAESVSRPDGGSSGGVLGGVTGLPRTGIYAALLVVIALVLIVAGRTLLGASRRRKEAERRARRGSRRSTQSGGTPVAR
jgi:hypothetical protein